MNNKTSIEAMEAKTNFYELLERVSEGAEITITKNDKPVAKLVPFEKPDRAELADLFQKMKGFGAAHPLNPQGFGKISYRDLIDGNRILTKTLPNEF